MSFPKKVLLLFACCICLLGIASLVVLTSINKLDEKNAKLINEKMYVFMQFKEAVNVSKNIEAAGAHFLITGKPDAHQGLVKAHLDLRNYLQTLMSDSRFSHFQDEIANAIKYEKIAEENGRNFFQEKLNNNLGTLEAVKILSKVGLPYVIKTQKELLTAEREAMGLWQESSASTLKLLTWMRTALKSMLYVMGALMILLTFALWKILKQKTLIDEGRNQLLLKSEKISNARKEAVEIVAHDLRSPLSSISMCFDLISDAEQYDHDQILQIGASSVNSALKLIEEILDHAKIESEKMYLDIKQYDLSSFISEHLATFSIVCKKKKVTFVYEIDPNLICHCDAVRLGQVITNLLTNALKFSDEGKRIEFFAIAKEGQILFHVNDEGPGIPEEYQQDVFAQYWQRKDGSGKSSKGLGLGLSIAKAIVGAHGGDIWVTDNTSGVGSSFQFTLPLNA